MRANEKKEELTRRDVLKKMAAMSCVAIVGPAAGCSVERVATVAAGAGKFDQALKLVAKISPLSNHGPMGAEALVALGREDTVLDFAEVYNRHHYRKYPERRVSVTSSNWNEALGSRDRLADWVAFFDMEIKAKGWKTVVAEWLKVLIPGLSAAGAHGLIRTGHALRSLERSDNETRRTELGQALGYWSAYYYVLPTAQAKEHEGHSPAEAVKLVPMIESEKVVGSRSVMRKIESVEGWEDFEGVINLIDPTKDLDKTITGLTETFADVYVKHVDQYNFVSLIHCVTGTAILRSIIPHCSTKTTRELIRYAWQMAAAVYSSAGNSTVNEVESSTDLKRDDLIERAVESNEVHSIKFTEACLKEYKINPKPVFLIAIDDALGRLGMME